VANVWGVLQDEFRQMMRLALSDLAFFSVLPDYIRLEKFRVVGNEVMIIDFDMIRKLKVALGHVK
jgi:hypothetical protein